MVFAPHFTTLEISVEALARLIGQPLCPPIIDVRIEADFAADPVLLPTALRRSHLDVALWGEAYRGQTVIIICHKGLKISHGVAAWLRQAGAHAVVLSGGFVAWRAAGGLTVNTSSAAISTGSLWVTRARPKIDRIACPWLIRRFVDTTAKFLFVPPAEVTGVAERFGAIPFDIEAVFWSHRGEQCTFDTMVAEFGLSCPALDGLANIVRAADTNRLSQVPEAAGLLAASLGLSQLYADDLLQLDAGMGLYDAFYSYCRDAYGETHDWLNKVA